MQHQSDHTQAAYPSADWDLDFKWLRLRHWVKARFGRKQLPDLNAILFLIGIQELGRWQDGYTKEEKQDLMHIAVCSLLSPLGYYTFAGRDADGWPHYEMVEPLQVTGVKDQSNLLKSCIVQYFGDWEAEFGQLEEE